MNQLTICINTLPIYSKTDVVNDAGIVASLTA
jgi:hypothetical protein